MTAPPPLAILLPTLRGGGAERLSLTLAREFVAKGHEVRFLLMQSEGELLTEAQSIGSTRSLGSKRVREAMRTLPSELAGMEGGALIANVWPLTAASAIALRMMPSKDRPLLALVEHNTLSSQYANWSRKTRIMLRLSQALACRLADRRISVSQGVAKDTAHLASLPIRRFDVIHNPVPAVKSTDCALAQAECMWGSRTGRRILVVGSLKRQKNQALAMAAFATIRAPGDRLMLLGEGEMRDELTATAQVMGVADAVLMPGFYPNPAAVFASADLFVLSSDYEGFGNVLVEALAAGLPVVSTDCPSGPAEILKGGQLGQLVPVGDAAALARAMAETLATPGDPALRYLRAADFAPHKIAAQYLETLFTANAAVAGG